MAVPFRLRETALNVGAELSVLKTSDGLGWPNLNVSLIAGRPYDYEIVHGGGPDLWVNVPLEPLDLSFIIGRKELHSIIQPHQLSVISPGTLVGTRRGNGARSLHVFLKNGILAEVAGELFDRDAKDVEIVSAFSFQDPGMSGLLSSLQQALFEPAEHSALKIEYISRGLAADVLRKHIAPKREKVEADASGRLTPLQARRVAEYIHDRLSFDITLNELAIVAGLSRTVFVKRFKASFRQSPHQHLIEARIRRAQQLLAKADMPVPQIALACGFSDQAHFTVRFKGATGLTPLAYRRLVE